MDEKEYFKKAFKIIDEQVILIAPHMEVKIPIFYFDRKIAEINGNNITTFGLFNMKIWNDDDFEGSNFTECEYLFSSNMTMIPTSIEKTKDNYILYFHKDDVFMTSVVIEKSVEVASKFVNLLLGGFLPDSIPYDEIIDFWRKNLNINGQSLGVNNTLMEMIISETSRNPDKMEEPFRIGLRDNPNLSMLDRVLIRIESIGKYTSALASVSSAYAKPSTATTINRTRENIKDRTSPIEEAIE